MRIGLGLMRINNMNASDVEKLLVETNNLGINFLDLADIYGKTKCEALVGEVFKTNPELRDKFYIQTKVGINTWEKGYDSSYEYIITKTQECIKRLNVKYLDCLLIHRPDIFMDNAEVARAVHELKAQGLIKDFGVSNFTKSEIEYLKVTLPKGIKYNQVQLGIGNTTMIDQAFYCNMPSKNVSKESDSLFFYLKKEGINIQCWSPFLYGFFEGSIFDEDKYPVVNQALKKYADLYHTSKCAIATAFLLKLDPNLIVITGSTNITHIKEAIDGESINLTKADWYRLYEETGHVIP